MQTAMEYVEAPANTVPRAVAVLETAFAEWEAQGDAECGAVCHPRRVDDDTWLWFQSRCVDWPGIDTPHFHVRVRARAATLTSSCVQTCTVSEPIFDPFIF